MGVIIKWSIPDTAEVTYDYTEVHRATSENGSYSLIATQAIADNTYFDIDGSSANWYKIRFKDDSESKYSSYSDPIQGGEFNAYCSFDDIRLLSGVTSSQLTDSQLFDLIKRFAVGAVNKSISREWRDERVLPISGEKENKIDGSNTVFYARHWPLCDLNDDGVVDESDLEVYSLDSEGVRSVLSVSSVNDVWLGKFTLSSAPASGVRLFLRRYRSANVEVYPNTHPRVREACALFASARALMRVEAGQYGSWRAGKVSVTKRNPAFRVLLKEFDRVVGDLKSSVMRERTGEQTRRIASFYERNVLDK